MLCPCPTGQAFLEGQQGDKAHPTPGVEGKACVQMASKSDGMTRKVGLGVQGHTAGGNTQERTKLWLSSGRSRTEAVLSGWGQVHPLVLALGKQKEKNHGKSAAGP